MTTYTSRSEEDTINLGYRFGQTLPANSVICFFGDLAAGKTTFIRGLTLGVHEASTAHVSSPTFTYLNIYEGKLPVFHFDLYRLKDADEFIGMGFDEYMTADGICCIEWSERIQGLLPKDAIHVEMKHIQENVRQILITPQVGL